MRQPVTFGKYLLLDRISVGGMAEVFKAKSYGVEGFEKLIAIKRILPSMGEDRDFIDMFIDEAKIAGQLSHANICQIFELGKVKNDHFIAMEFIWGKDLLQIQNRLKKRHEVMAVTMAVFIVAKICEGLDYAHRKKDQMGQPMKIVHRDCSPQNILVSFEGEVKLIDFGIAKAASRSAKTNAGVLKGKFGYMSPEQVRGLPLDHRSDIFAIGTILYESITGVRLFMGESDFSTLEKVRNADVTPPRSLNADIPQEIEKIVMRALQRDPKARYQTCGEMTADLRQFLTRQEKVYTSKILAEWLRAAFATELLREKKQLERFRNVGRDGKPKDGSKEVAVDAETMLGDVGLDDLIEDDPGEFEEGPTEIFGEIAVEEAIAKVKADVDEAREKRASKDRPPTNSPPLPSSAPVSPLSRAPSAPVSPLPSAPIPPISRPPSTPVPKVDIAAAIADVVHAPPEPPAGSGHYGPFTSNQQPQLGTPVGTQQLPAGMPQQHGPPSQTQIPSLPPSGYPPGTGPVYPISQQTPSQAFPRISSYPGAAGVSYPGTGQVIPLPPPGRRKRSSLGKDIAIGFLIAALVLGMFVGGKFFFFKDEKAAVTPPVVTGSIAVVVADQQPAEVSLDGEVKGVAQGPDPLVVEAVAVGEHNITVTRKGVEPCNKTVTVEGEQTVVVNCSFAVAPTTGRLVFDKMTDDLRVFVDDQEISTQSAREPVELEPGVDHQIVVKRGDKIIDQATVTVEAGEERRFEIGKERQKGAVVVKDKGEDAAEKAEREKADREKADREKADREKADREKADREKREASNDKGNGKTGDSNNNGASTKPPPKREDVGYFMAYTTPWARVFIDGRDTGKMTPIAKRNRIRLTPGRHTVTFVAEGKKFTFPVTIEVGKNTKMLKDLPVD